MRIDAKASPELRATILAVRALDKTLQKTIRQHTKQVAAQAWMEALRSRAQTKLEHRALVDTAVVAVSNQNVRIRSASKGRPLSGGFSPKLHGHAAEFGADQTTPTTYQRKSRTGGSAHQVTRRATTGLRPRNREGYVFWPTAREMVPRLASLWVQTTVRTIATALEGKQE